MDETENDLKWKELQELWVYLEIEREHLKKKLEDIYDQQKKIEQLLSMSKEQRRELKKEAKRRANAKNKKK